jgi:probable addiction module antidote protein
MSKLKVKTRVWDPAEHLESEEDIAAYLQAAFEEGDATLIAAALGDIARAKGMSQIARETGLGRESLYKALSAEGNVTFHHNQASWFSAYTGQPGVEAGA